VAVEFSFIAELPAGYDSRTRMTLTPDNRVIVAHPEHPPLVLSASGQWLDLKAPPVHSALRSSTC
jgi:hypothetical protein